MKAFRLALAALASLLALPALAQETVDFAGASWLVRTYPGGPGPNVWRAENVRVDDKGLHLSIRQHDGVWSAAEVVLLGPPLGFGTYEFEIEGDLANLDSNAVLGLFNYPASPDIGPDGTNEIDIEFSQWGDRSNPNRLNWNIHPARADGENGHHAIPLELDGPTSTHRFIWSAQSIAYASFSGTAAEGNLAPIGEWTYAPADFARDIPQQPLGVHLNLWLVEGRAPASGEPVEITIRAARYTPNP